MTPDPHPNPHPDPWHDQDMRGRAADDVTREFWGDGAGWPSQPADPAESAEDAIPGGLGATLGRWWSSSRRRNATRTHAPAASGAFPDQADHGIAPTDDDHDDPATDWDDAWDTTPSEPPRSGVDPLLARLGGLAVVVTLLVPVVMGFTSDDGDSLQTAAIAVELPLSASGDQPADQPAAAASETAADATTAQASAATPPLADVNVVVESTTTATRPPVTAAAEALAVDRCALEYEVAAGDFWIRIADGSGAPLADVLAVNDATVSTPLYPGRSICLPAGATIPPPPPAATTAPPTTPVNSTSARNSSTSSNTSTASTTPTTTTPPPPPSTVSPAEVEAIIRSVWPDELEERALEVARRESNYEPTAKNSCCYGLFQVYWSAHRSWLSGLGISSAEQLYDPATNARVALALYERAGGWGPWGG
jgi:hypothetical protein